MKIFMPAGASEPVYAPYTQHYPPNANAALRWLMNRQPNKWRDKREIDHTGSIAHQIAAMTPEERARDAIERVRARLAALRTIEQDRHEGEDA